MPVEIHPTRAEELTAVRHVHQQAFDGRSNEARLVELLHADEDFMVSEPKPNALEGIRGTVKYQPEFAETGC